MQNRIFSNNNTKREVYESPVFNEFLVETQKIICGSETERVDETDGEW
ncbi:MAG: hypothetical protein J6W86_02715 [Bacteroidales bacterium]|nr:hypothetical protein [Bacteroidales bacterium]